MFARTRVRNRRARVASLPAFSRAKKRRRGAAAPGLGQPRPRSSGPRPLRPATEARAFVFPNMVRTWRGTWWRGSMSCRSCTAAAPCPTGSRSARRRRPPFARTARCGWCAGSSTWGPEQAKCARYVRFALAPHVHKVPRACRTTGVVLERREISCVSAYKHRIMALGRVLINIVGYKAAEARRHARGWR